MYCTYLGKVDIKIKNKNAKRSENVNKPAGDSLNVNLNC